MTQALTILCENCGSSLQVAKDSIRFVTCGHCHSELQIARHSPTVQALAWQRIVENTSLTVDELHVIDAQNELGRLDRDWQVWRENHLFRTVSGQMIEPAPPVLARSFSHLLLINSGVGLIVMILLLMLGADPVIGGIALLIPPLTVLITRDKVERELRFARCQDVYQKKRQHLLQEIAQARLPEAVSPSSL